MEYQYFKEFYTIMYGMSETDIIESFNTDFIKVANVAIDAVLADKIEIAKALAERAHSLLSQTERNTSGYKRRLELRMKRALHEANLRNA